MLTGATKLGPELAYAVLTLLFFNYNLKRIGLSDIPSSCFVNKTNHRGSSSSEQKQLMARRFPRMKNLTDQNIIINGRLSGLADDSLLDEIGIYWKMLFDSMDLVKRDLLKISYIRFTSCFDWINDVVKLDSANSSTNDEANRNEHRVRLHHVVSKHNKLQVSMKENGDCAFLSLACGLKQNINSDPTTMEDYKQWLLIECNITTQLISSHIELEVLASALRTEFVNYLLKPETLEKFKPMTKLTTAGFIAEVSAFKDQGTFSGEIGDLVMPVMANLLACPIIVLTSIENLPVLSLYPDLMQTAIPLFVAYNQYGPGHYDAIMGTENDPSQNVHEPETVQSVIACPGKPHSCRCGVNESTSNEIRFCINSTRKTRCPCFKTRVTCSERCRCKNCGNMSSSAQKRKVEINNPKYCPRRRLSSNYKQSPSETFLKDLGASISGGDCTLLERCLILSVVNVTRINDIGRSGKPNPSLIHAIYNTFVDKTDKTHLRPRSFLSISSLLKVMLPEKSNNVFVE